MTWKIAGTLLILFAAAWSLRSYFQRQHYIDAQAAELIWSLEHIATEIRWSHRAFPDILEELSEKPFTGKSFESIVAGLTGEISLQLLWNNEFKQYYPAISDVLTRIDISGDEEHLTNSFLQASEELKHFLRVRKDNEKDKGKLSAAMVCTGAALLLILLA